MSYVRSTPMNHAPILLAAFTFALVGCASGTATGALSDPATADGGLAHPDLSGTWVLDAAASQASVTGAGGGTGAGTGAGGGLALGSPAERITISQNATQLTIEQIFGSIRTRLTYRLDGRSVRNNVPVGGGRTSGSGTFQSAWDGERLVTTFTVQIARVPARRYREVRSLTADGSLVVEIIDVDRPTLRRRTVYRR